MTPGHRAPDPREARDAAEFLACLQALKDWSGLTYRELATRAEAYGDVLPRSTVANMLARATVPREELLTAYVRACGAAPAALEDWLTARKRLAVRGGDEGPGHQGSGAPDPEAASPDFRTAEVPSPRPEPTEPLAQPPSGAAETTVTGSGMRVRMWRGIVSGVALAGLGFAGVSFVAVLRDGHGGHPPRLLTAPAAGDVRIRVVGTDLCLGERRGTRSGQIHQLPCPDAEVPLYSLEEAGGGRWRIVSDHPDYGPGCSGIPSGGRIPGAAYEDSECGDPSRVEAFALEPYGTPVQGYRIVPKGSAGSAGSGDSAESAGSAAPGSCVTVVGDRTAVWARLAQTPCAPDAAGQLFSFDRR
ncbi:helix-turn-helix domain-containing protein [Streptomyces sp. NPDC056144]|uniref:helix-turn-helix domain-containing protein n=1 Tax=unclassified Streptomyces TaxID=2593676 RepID=UPI0035DE2D14